MVDSEGSLAIICNYLIAVSLQSCQTFDADAVKVQLRGINNVHNAEYGRHGVTVNGSWFKSQFLCRVHIFSLCLCGFSLGTRVSSYSPSLHVWVD